MKSIAVDCILKFLMNFIRTFSGRPLFWDRLRITEPNVILDQIKRRCLCMSHTYCGYPKISVVVMKSIAKCFRQIVSFVFKSVDLHLKQINLNIWLRS